MITQRNAKNLKRSRSEVHDDVINQYFFRSKGNKGCFASTWLPRETTKCCEKRKLRILNYFSTFLMFADTGGDHLPLCVGYQPNLLDFF